jgi:phosphatidylinositol-3,4,5-trisphosphate 3-phosphatase/dual-specificity protein phosphatase PTEN
MGFPAIGVEGLYRNSRKDVKRFLDTRHKDKYHVFNFCPLAENGIQPKHSMDEYPVILFPTISA